MFKLLLETNTAAVLNLMYSVFSILYSCIAVVRVTTLLIIVRNSYLCSKPVLTSLSQCADKIPR